MSIQQARFQFTLTKLVLFLTFTCILTSVGVVFARALRNARRQALATAAQGPLNQLVLALHNYHDHYRMFPPSFLADSRGTPQHSWRVLILPYIDQRALYNAYDFSEPWNGPNNSKLLNQMPRVFGSPTEPRSDRFANIVAISGPGSAFPGNSSTRLSDFTDGAANSLLLTEITDSNLPWLEPRDIDTQRLTRLQGDPSPADDKKTLAASATSWRMPYVVFADSIHAYSLRRDMPTKLFKALATIAGGEPISREELIEAGFLKY